MGSGQGKNKKKVGVNKPKVEEQKRVARYDDDVLDAANLAIAIEKEDLTTSVELFIHCDNLPKMDAFSMSDPMVVAFQEQNGKWIYIDRTEYIADNLNPKFVKTFIVSYNFERKQRFRFEVYDIDNFDTVDDLEAQDIIGHVECEINEIMMAPTQSISKQIESTQRKKSGTLHIRGAEYDMVGNKILFQLGCLQLTTRAEIQLRMSYLTDNKDWMPIYTSEPIKNNRKQLVTFNDFYLPLSKFGNNDQAQIKIDVEEYSKTKQLNILGDCELTLQQLMENSGKQVRLMKNGIIIGQLKVIQIVQHSRYSFVNYIYSGTKIQVITAIDFTHSKAPPDVKDEDHALTIQQQYRNAIMQVLSIMQHFNSDYRMPVYGFGAKLPPFKNIVSHCFSCTKDIFDPYVYGGPDEIVKAYELNFREVTTHGPTVLSQVIDQAHKFAVSEKVDQFNQKYYILVIFSDAQINDIQSTIDALYRAQNSPLSVILVSVGNNDITDLKALESEPYSIKYGAKIQNNILKIFSLNKFNDYPQNIARELLSALPKQFLRYMDEYHIVPAKGKKNSKAATNEFIYQKIEEGRKLKKKEMRIDQKNIKIPLFLKQAKEEFYNQLVSLGYDSKLVSQVLQEGVKALDIHLVVEKMSEFQGKKKEGQVNIPTRSEIKKLLPSTNTKLVQRVFCIKQQNKLDEVLQLKKKETQLVTNNFLFTLHNPELKPKPVFEPKYSQPIQIQQPQVKQHLEKICLRCFINPIQLVLMPCGHACLCMDCFMELDQCQACKQKVQFFAQIQ